MKNEIDKVLALWRSDMPEQVQEKENMPSLEQINKVAAMCASGEHYYFIFNFFEMKLEYIHPGVKKVLGIEPKDVSERTLLEVLTPKSLEKIHHKEETAGKFFHEFISPEDITNFKTSYFVDVRNAKRQERKLLHQSTAITVSPDNRIERVFCIHTDVTHLKLLKDETVSFISLTEKPSYYGVDPIRKNFTSTKDAREEISSTTFSKREKEIIESLSKGGTARQIAERLDLKENTVRTHRQKILEKAGCHNSAELITKCLAWGII